MSIRQQKKIVARLVEKEAYRDPWDARRESINTLAPGEIMGKVYQEHEQIEFWACESYDLGEVLSNTKGTGTHQRLNVPL
jgi:hypothetical protein